MTTDTTAPAPTTPPSDSERRWMEPVPQDWNQWLTLRREVTETRHTRETFRNWMLAKLDENSNRLELGLGLLASGEPERALPHLQAADGGLAKLLAAKTLGETQLHDDAVTALHGLTGDAQVGARARLELLDLQFRRRDLEGLQKVVAEIAGSGASEADKAYAAGLQHELEGNHEQAVASLSSAVESDPLHAEATFQLAVLLERHGDDEGALELYERFLAGELPTHVGALMNLGMLLEDNDAHSKAVACFAVVAQCDPRNRRAQRYLRDAEASVNQYYDESRERKADKQNAVLRIPVTDFELSVRARNCLQRMNIHTLGDLVSRTESELLSFKNFGETSLQEVKDILSMKGLRLGMAPGPTPGATDGGTADLASLAGDGDVGSVKISELDLSVRSRAALAMLGITTVSELAQTTETTLLSCKNFGQTSLDEIKSKLRGLGLELAG